MSEGMQDILPIIILLKSMTKSNLFTPNHIKNIIPTDNIAEITVNNSALSAPNFSKSGYRKAPINKERAIPNKMGYRSILTSTFRPVINIMQTTAKLQIKPRITVPR